MIDCITLSDLLDIVKAISVVLGAGVAIYGINSWRREILWKGRYELAEKVLALFYECSDIIDDIRRPLSFTGEGSSREKNAKETDKEREIRDYAFIPYERFRPYQEKFSELQSLKYRFITMFGKEHEKNFIELIGIVNNIFFYSNEIARIKLGEYGHQTDSEKGKEIRNLLVKVFSLPNKEKDEVYQKKIEIIRDIEIICKKIIIKK